MKKSIAILGLCLAMFYTQKGFSQVQYEKGDALLNAGLGLGYYYAGGIPVLASLELAVTDAISVGPYVGFTAWSQNFSGFGYSWKYSYVFIDFGARGSYHFSKHLELNTDKLDLYGGAFLGYVVTSQTYDGPNTVTQTNNYGSGLRGGIFAGVRYYFSPKFGVNGEVGYGIVPLLAGVTFRL